MEPIGAEKAQTFDDLIVNSLVEASDDDAHRLIEFRDAVRNNPELRAEAISQIEGLFEAS